MQNYLLYFYDINVETIHRKDNNYYFEYNNKTYYMFLFDQNIEEIYEIYRLNQMMLQQNILCHKIILTKQGNILILINDNYYILMLLQVNENEAITFKDVINFNMPVLSKEFNKLIKNNWAFFWEKKIDYIEYQFNQVDKKYLMLDSSINYYLGLWENAISYLNSAPLNNSEYLFVSHKRVNIFDNKLSFFNPLNLIIDFKERDISEYLKSSIIYGNINESNIISILKKINIKKGNVYLFISRLLFPSYYFDVYEQIINNNLIENKILFIINKNKNMETILSHVFRYYLNRSINLPTINWLLKKTN